MQSKWLTAGLVAMMMTAPSSLAAQTKARSVAVTFDDVPGVALSRCSDVVATNRRLLATLKKHSVPATIFAVTGRARCGAELLPRIVKLWLADGHEVASHSHTHSDINRIPIAQYLADVDTADRRLRAMLPRDKPLRYYRAPFLHTGNTAAKKNAITAKMRALKYAPGVVTI